MAISKKPFGVTPDGHDVTQFTLTNARGASVRVINYGAILTNIIVPDRNGVLGAEIEPKNRVLPLLRGHFCQRYANERFFIYDRTHRELLLYADGRSRITQVEGFQPVLPESEELYFRALWKRFFQSVTVQERENPRCQNTFLPKRYRGTMTEFLPLEYEKERGAQMPSLPGASG